MASWISYLLFLSLLSHSIPLIKCDVDDDLLLQGINQYRTSRNLTAVITNEAADCLADEIADTYSNRICTNTTAPNYNSTLPKFSDYPGVLSKCGQTGINTTGEGHILLACAPVSAQQQTLVLSLLTSNYETYLNSTHLSAIGIGTEDDWAVVVLFNSNTTGGGSSNTTPGAGSNTTTTGPGSGSNTSPGGEDASSGASSLAAAISPLAFAIICLFILV